MDNINDKWQCPNCYAWLPYEQKVCTGCRNTFWAKICPPFFQATDPAKLPAKLLKDVMGWQYGPQGLILFGNTGIGKTRAGILLVKREFDAGKSIDMFIGSRFSNECSRVFYDNDGEQWLDKLCKVELLFLDDIDKVKLTPCVQWGLYSVIDTRINWLRPTVITTNMNSKLLGEMFDPHYRDALVRRLKESFKHVTL